MSDRFYQDLPALAWPLEALLRKPSVFKPVPPDWEVIVTDIKGSTQIVSQGRYRDVNTIAASCVIACLNVARHHDVEIGFFYGGDGASLVIPPSLHSEIQTALWTLRANTHAAYGLVLRVGSLPVSEIYAAGHMLDIAKWSVAPGYDQAVFLGNGLAYADKRIKGEAANEIVMPEAAGDVDLDGLKCRWGEIKPDQAHQEVVSLIVHAHVESDQAAIYAEVLATIEDIYGDYQTRHPVTSRALQPSFNMKGAEYYARLSVRGWRPWVRAYQVFHSFVSVLLFRFGISIGRFVPSTYIQAMVAATDTLHLNGTLFTVMRGTPAQRQALRKALNAFEEDGQLIYGLSFSPASIMTCYVQKHDRGHVHFLDGTGGGYTRASKEFKVKVKQYNMDM